MSNFEKFYNGFCRRVIPLVLLGLVFITAELFNVFSGRALSTVDMVVLSGGTVEICSVLIFWLVLTLVRKIRHDKYV